MQSLACCRCLKGAQCWAQGKLRSPRLVLLILLAVVLLGAYGLLSFGYRVAAGKNAPPLTAVVRNAWSTLLSCRIRVTLDMSCPLWQLCAGAFRQVVLSAGATLNPMLSPSQWIAPAAAQ